MNFKKLATIVAAAGALTALAIPAMAEVTVYGSARVGTFWDTRTDARLSTAVAPKNNTDFVESNFNGSRVGANFSDGSLTGKVELGLGSNGNYGVSYGTGSNTQVYTRLVYGEYKFDAGKLLVGQNFTPYTFLGAQVAYDDNAGNGFGTAYDGRQPQVKFTLNNGLYIDLIRNGGTAAPAYPTNNTSTTVTDQQGTVALAETLIPKVAIGYEGKAGDFTFGGGALGQTFKYNAGNRVNSFMLYAHGTATAGPLAFALNLSGGENLGDMSLVNTSKATLAATGTGVYNTLTYAALGQITYTVSPTLKTNIGAGTHFEKAKTNTGVSYQKNNTEFAAFVNVPITLAKNVSITPEITYINHGNDVIANSATTYNKGAVDYVYGAKWQFDF